MNPLLVEACNLYDVAPVDAFQVRVGFMEIPVELFDGEAKVGVVGMLGVPKYS